MRSFTAFHRPGRDAYGCATARIARLAAAFKSACIGSALLVFWHQDASLATRPILWHAHPMPEPYTFLNLTDFTLGALTGNWAASLACEIAARKGAAFSPPRSPLKREAQ